MSSVSTRRVSAIVPRLGRCDIPEGVHIVPVRPALTRHVYAIWRAGAG